MSKRKDKRLWFICQALNAGLTTNANLANEWYIANKGAGRSTDFLLADFKAWLDAGSEPELGQMFDRAHEDQCRDACGL